MATARSQVTKYLNISKFGKEISPDKKIKGEIAALVKKRDGSKSYAAVKWNNKVGRYVITYDPTPGMCDSIVSIFSLDEEDETPETSTEEVQEKKEPTNTAITAKRGRPSGKKK